MTPMRMIVIIVTLLAAALSVAAPLLAVGDTWTSVTRDIFTGLEISTETARVEAADAQGYRLHVTGRAATDCRS